MHRSAARAGLRLAVLALGFGSVAAQDTAPAPRPNVVLILADDLGYADLGCQGSGYYRTPHIDALAAGGLRLRHGYANAPNCAPTRACLLSGQDTPRHGVYTVNSGARGRAALRASQPPPNETTLPLRCVTLAEALRARGYATAHVGKWHLGAPGEAGPRQQGFDVQVAGTAAGHPRSYFSPYHNPELADGPEGEYLTDRLTDEAITILRRFAADAARPFFLYFAPYTVHTPLQSRADDRAVFADREADGDHDDPRYAGMIRALDRSVGRLLGELDELDLTGNTLVVFTSDNGGVGGYADLHTREITDNRPLRGGKGMLLEGGIRVPWIVRWPGVTTPGTVSDAPVITYDLYPTLLAAAGPVSAGEKPGAATPEVLDGVDITPVLRGDTDVAERTLVWHFPGYLQANTRRGTWRTRPAAAIRRGNLKLIEDLETGRCALYDLAVDPGETTDLSDARRADVMALRATLESWRALRSAPMPRPKTGD